MDEVFRYKSSDHAAEFSTTAAVAETTDDFTRLFTTGEVAAKVFGRNILQTGILKFRCIDQLADRK